MTETFLAGGKTIRLEVHEPATFTKPIPAILLLHGSGGNLSFWLDRLTPHLASAGVALFAPHYFDRTNTERADLATITDGVHVPLWLDTLSATRDLIATRPSIDPTRIALVGISLGSFLSLAFAAVNSASPEPAVRSKIKCLVDLSGGLISPFAEQATTAFPPTLILHGEADNIVPVSRARELDAQLTRLKVPHETRILPREGHWFSTMAQLQLMMAVGTFLRKNL
jgi:carboxymethylenebutenolidase